jgi:hypothetical protein
MFSCTGRVVALLKPQLMIHPPQLPQDLVLMVVPDTWSFLERPLRDSASAFTQMASAKPSCSDPRSKFMTPVKRNAGQPFDPFALDISSSTNGAGIFSSPRTYDPSQTSCNSTILTQPQAQTTESPDSPPYKRTRPSYTLQRPADTDASSSPTTLNDHSNTSSPKGNMQVQEKDNRKEAGLEKASYAPITDLSSVPPTAITSVGDTNKVQRHRQGTKRMLDLDY